MKKGLVILMAVAMVFAMTSLAMAKQESNDGLRTTFTSPAYGTETTDPAKGNIVSEQYTPVGHDGAAKKFNYFEQGAAAKDSSNNTITYEDNAASTHKYGTWNSPYTYGIDGYNYNDAQDYIDDGVMVDLDNDTTHTADAFASGPHGGYLTSTHRCRECHAVHRAAGKFKLLRSDSRFEACDWCHGTGAGSGYNIQMDNNSDYTEEYNVGHTMGYGIQSGKWKAPDDTFPAFTPNYYMGGFSCFDCHSPHANPARMFGFDKAGKPVGLWEGFDDGRNGGTADNGLVEPGERADRNGNGVVECYSLVNSGHDQIGNVLAGKVGKNFLPPYLDPEAKGNQAAAKGRPWYVSGSWLLIENPDREIASASKVVPGGIYADENATLPETSSVSIAVGQEIPDYITAGLNEFDTNTVYPVNKYPTDWDNPVGLAKWRPNPLTTSTTTPETEVGYTKRNTELPLFVVDEFCTDCHDGNAGSHRVAAPLFSEDRALRSQTTTSDNAATHTVTSGATDFKGSYDIAYGHDVNSRHCGRNMVFNPEDDLLGGPRCRNCHKGSSACGACHATAPDKPGSLNTTAIGRNYDADMDASNGFGAKTAYVVGKTSIFTGTFTGAFGQGDNMARLFGSYNQAKFLNSPMNQQPPTIDTTTYASSYPLGFYKKSQTVSWDTDWRTDAGTVAAGDINTSCSDDGFSWPHRTLGWKMLKDDLFGLDFVGPEGSSTARSNYIAGTNNNDGFAEIGESRGYDVDGSGSIEASETTPVHDLDSVCLDCHNPTVWGATSQSDHIDSPNNNSDDKDDDLLLRGLP